MIKSQSILGHWVSFCFCFCFFSLSIGLGVVGGGLERYLLNSKYGKGQKSLVSMTFLYFFDAG